MRLMITGINGFVAGHFIDYLESIATPIEILGIGRSPYNVKQRKSPKSITYCNIDLLDKKAVSQVVADFRPDYLLHLASVSSVGLSWKYPNESFVNNTNIFLNLIEELRNEKSNCRVLSIGSSEEYGIVTAEQLPLTETAPLAPISPYAVARVSQEMISTLYAKGYGLDIIMTRSFNHFGPAQSDKFVIASFARQLTSIKKSGQKRAVIKAGNLDIIRDFVDVRDVVKAYYLLLQNGSAGEVYNICSGNGHSLREILETMADMMELELVIETDPELIRPADNPVIIGSNKKINTTQGWQPEISLTKSLQDILDWWMQQD